METTNGVFKMYRTTEKFDNPVVSDNYNAANNTGIHRHRNDRGLDSNGKKIYNYYISFNEHDTDLMLAIYKRIDNHCFDYFSIMSNGSFNGSISELTHMESIKIITLYDIYKKENELRESKLQLKRINKAIENKQTRLY